LRSTEASDSLAVSRLLKGKHILRFLPFDGFTLFQVPDQEKRRCEKMDLWDAHRRRRIWMAFFGGKKYTPYLS
jgi:hypothetical protein